MINGLTGFSAWEALGVALIFTHISIVSITIFLHRAQAHRALDVHPILSHFFRFWLWLNTGIVTREWVAIHRKHHAKCETEDDPHSPQIEGLKEVLWKGSELYRAEALNQETLEKYGRGVPDDWMERNVYTKYSFSGLILMLMINVLLFGPIGLTVWALQAGWSPFFAAGVINGVGHYFGYRNYETEDAATNISPWGIIIGGEELHNNHHAFPSSAKLSNKSWEFDIGWMYITIFSAVGLAKVKKVAPVPQRDKAKKVLDVDALQAVIRNRLHISTEFGRNVMLPVMREELAKASASRKHFLKRAKRLLIAEETRLDEGQRARLTAILEDNQALEQIYEYRRQLQQIWARTAMSYEQLLPALQDWCARAEASGIQVLEEFADSLRSYTLEPVRVRA